MRLRLAYVLFILAVAAGGTSTAHAERVKQWIAPPECVFDAGLSTQHILTEQECYQLLHPPVQGGGEVPSSPDITAGSSGNKYMPVVFLPYGTPQAELQSGVLDTHKHTIIIDHAKKPRTGTTAVILIAAIYVLLLLAVVVKRTRIDE